MKLIYTFFSLLLLINASCKKEPVHSGTCEQDCLTFKGRLVEQQTGNGIGNVDMNLFFNKYPGGLGGNGKTTHLLTTQIDADGFYEFSIPDKYLIYSGNFEFVVNVPGYINQNMNFERYVAKINTNGITDSLIESELRLWKSAPLTVRVKTVNNNNFDRFYFNQFFDNVSYTQFEATEKNRQPFDVTYQLQTAADIPTRINWRTSNVSGSTGSVILQGSDTIVVASGTSGNLLIEL